MFENRLKTRIQYCERSELRLHFEWIFGTFNELLSTQNVNVARFARNIECDFFCDFQTLCGWKKKKIGNWILQKAKLADKWAQMKL